MWRSNFAYLIRSVCFILIDNYLTSNYLEKKHFKAKQGYSLNLQSPKSFNEKIVWKKLNKRKKRLVITEDKYKARKYVKDKIGEKHADEILIPLLYSGDSPSTIPFSSLPENYVIKANHNSGPPIIIRGEKEISQDDIIREMERQMNRTYGLNWNAWAYSKITPRIVVEELLLNSEGQIPRDYKFFVFHGECHLIQVDIDRFVDHTRVLYNTDWELLDVSLEYPKGEGVEKPVNLNRMIKYAEKISEEFSFARVDLYNVDGSVYFGEITHYPGAGHEKFSPTEFDFKLGGYWSVGCRN
jgi:hypothetical protein